MRSPMGDQGCGGTLGVNANVTNTPAHVRAPMGNISETQPEVRLGGRAIKLNPFGLGGAERAVGLLGHRANKDAGGL